MEYAERNHDDEIARLQANKKAIKTARERLESYVCRVIKARGVKALKGNTNTLSVRPSDAVVIKDQTSVPLRFATACVEMPAGTWLALGRAFQEAGIKAELKPDKVAIKKALKAGEDVPGCDLEYRDNLPRR